MPTPSFHSAVWDFSWEWTSRVEYGVLFHFIHCLPEPLGLIIPVTFILNLFSSCTMSIDLQSTVTPLELGLATLFAMLPSASQVSVYSSTQSVVFDHGDYGHGGFGSGVFQNLVPFSSTFCANLNTYWRFAKPLQCKAMNTFHAAADK